MDALTPEYIVEIVSRTAPMAVIDPTSIAYLQHLLTPYAQALEQADSLDSVSAWLDAAFPSDLARQAKNSARRYTHHQADAIQKLKGVRREVIETVIDKVVDIAGDLARDASDLNILPWDIKRAITIDDELEHMFKQYDGTNKLEVTVHVGTTHFTHSLTEDFVTGILLYYQAAGQPITLLLYGIPLTTDYLTNNEDNRHTADAVSEGLDPAKYLVSLGGEDVAFRTPDFLQGAATAGQWLNEDYHTRVTHLRTVNDGNVVDLTF